MAASMRMTATSGVVTSRNNQMARRGPARTANAFCTI